MKFVIAIACAVLLAACHRDPRAVEARHLRDGDAYSAQGRYREAIVEYRGAIQAMPSDGIAHRKLSAAYLATGDGASALRELVKAAEQMPDDGEVQLQASRALLLAGRFADAKARAERLLAKDSRNVAAHVVLGNAEAGLKDLDSAISEIDDAIRNDPQRSLSYANLGALELAQGRRDEAERAFAQAVAVDPRSVPAILALANFHWAVGRLDAAEGELTKAVALDPHSVSAQRALAAFYISTNRSEKAEAPLAAAANATSAMGPRLILADYYRAAGKTDRALHVLETIAKDRDWFAAATTRIALIDAASGSTAAAHRAIDSVLARQPRDVRAQVVKARLLLSERRFADALVHAKAAAASNPRSPDAHLMVGTLYAALDQPDRAIESWETALRLRPGDEQALTNLARAFANRGDWASAAQHAQTAVTVAPRNREARLLLARALTERGDLHNAEQELTALAHERPDDPALQFAFGRFYLATRDSARARAAFAAAAAGDPINFAALGALTDLDVSEGKPADAVARLQRRLDAAPDSPDLLLLVARAHEAARDFASEESALRRALANDPSRLDAYRMLARVFIRQKRLDDARREFDAVTTRDPKAVGAYTMSGILLEQLGRPLEARAKYEQALAANPRSGIAANNLAWLLAQDGGNLDLALQLAQTAKSVLPNQPEVDDTIGWIYYRKGLTEPAITYLREAVAKNASNPTATYHLALAYQRNGANDVARALFDRAKALRQ